jgi:GAF domain-containing protein
VHIDDEALASSLRRLREHATDAGVSAALTTAVDAVNQVVGHSGAGIMFVTEAGHLGYVAASDEAGRQLEQAQAEAGQGPCYESYVYAREVTTGDARADDRWPELRRHLPDAVRAVAGVPVMLGGSPVGTLNVYRHAPFEWDDSDVSALSAYAAVIADVVAVAVTAHEQGDLARQLQYALDYRVIIERGVGYLMGSRGLDAVTAFSLLRRQARDSRCRVADVAAELMGDPAPQARPEGRLPEAQPSE